MRAFDRAIEFITRKRATMYPGNQLSGLGKIDRRRFLGAATLGGIWTSLNLPLALRAQAEELPLVAEPKIGGLDHTVYMRRAIIQANKNPRLPFGAVIVEGNDGSIVAEGHNRTALNPTYHGEIDAIDQYAAGHLSADWSKLVLYTTCEPCPMCQSAVMWAGIGAVVYGTSIPFIAKLAGGKSISAQKKSSSVLRSASAGSSVESWSRNATRCSWPR